MSRIIVVFITSRQVWIGAMRRQGQKLEMVKWKSQESNGLSFYMQNAFKHIFVALSSVYPNTKSYITHSGNVKLHGMMNITPGSLACTATQVWFALSAQSMFLRSHTVTDLEGFYNSILDLLKDLDEIEEVNALLAWWNWRAPKNSALAKIREKCALLKKQVESRSGHSCNVSGDI
ncbi:hypothetical protein SERLADRAFT_404532 [Serpula lacrymans var. lacrymans S7.9]|uniref:Uncharacterized protein n=1 Tax=Serpula lacrymans var. lacrymans (strain S7.9) TaxID=578457 RepID=F8NDF1_SERL9|nr:uncharacterized protein SERLADRAFT_404532 [Serpula lacrymans var. lacrymans S7.9]EGO30289.1 hypothetical protein SERLADRAFT_404532 [Serpula lacrymans var. lacrymans S7.9]